MAPQAIGIQKTKSMLVATDATAEEVAAVAKVQ